MPGLLLKVDDQDDGATLAATNDPVDYGFIVVHQKVELDIDFPTRSLRGQTIITILPQSSDLDTIRIDARQCSIPRRKVLVNGKVASFTYDDPHKKLEVPEYFSWGAEQHELQRERLKSLSLDHKSDGALEISLPDSVRIEEVDPFSENAANSVTQRAIGSVAARNSSVAIDGNPSAVPAFTPKAAAEQASRFQPLTVTIPFTTTRFREGLHFVGVDEGDARFPHAYTKHSIEPGMASSIFPCVDDPAMRYSWDISIKCSRTLGDALKRRSIEHGHKSNHHKSMFPNGLTESERADVEESFLSEEEKLLEMVVVCSGEQVDEVIDLDDSSKKIVTFQCASDIAAMHVGFVIGPFEQVDLSEYREDEDEERLGQGQSTAIFGYCLPARTEELRNTCAPLAHAIDYFVLNFGSFPFSESKFIFVDDQINDIEHTASLSICSSRLLFGEDIIDPEKENIRKLVHAIASQYVGVSIVPNQPADRWLVTGISHFMTNLFMKLLCGNNEFMFRQKLLSDKLVEVDIDRPSLLALGEIVNISSFERDFMELKAPLVLFILDKRIAKSQGGTGITRVISKMIVNANAIGGADTSLSTEGFRKSCEKITKYRDTDTFFNQWVLGAGCPKFTIAQKFNKKRLCVEMTITQTQASSKLDTQMNKHSFHKTFKEQVHGVTGSPPQNTFTGPLTIRIHEADGTPYEHIVMITEQTSKIEIPYNTKYKRLKRNRRRKELANAGAGMDINAENQDDVLIYCLGDVLQTPQDMQEWGLSDWNEDQDRQMENESYEWIRIDADFEWICEKKFLKMEPWMYMSQLQQDRDISAQFESLLYLDKQPPHPLVATFLIRTLMDRRYFYGIRVMGAESLAKHSTLQETNRAGFRHLEKAFQEFFCYEGTKMPRSNDFTDKQAYWIELAIPRAMARIREKDGMCFKQARQFILDQLRFNDNGNNEYSDNFKVANLLTALTESLIPASNSAKSYELALGDDDVVDDEPLKFRDIVLEELDRYSRMDEWIDSYQNIYTITVLECKQKLMKAGVIPLDALEFAQYLHDGTAQRVRIKAFDALADLGFLKNTAVSCLLANSMSTDPSPWVRNQLTNIFFYGLGVVGLGDYVSKRAPAPIVEKDGLVIEEASTTARQEQAARTDTLVGTLAAIKLELGGDRDLINALWKAVLSPVITAREQIDFLDLCRMVCYPRESLILKLKYPRYWKVKHHGKGRLTFKHSKKIRTRMVPKIVPKPKPIPIPQTPQAPPIHVQPVRPPPTEVGPSSAPAIKIKIGSLGGIPKPSATPTSALKIPSLPKPTSSLGDMRPPKRPLPADVAASSDSPHQDKKRRKIVKLKGLPRDKFRRIIASVPRPMSKKPSPARSTPQPKPSSKPYPPSSSAMGFRASPAQFNSSNASSYAGSNSASGTGSSNSARKPLPEGRKPLPGSAQPSTPLPPPPSSTSSAEPPRKPSTIIKLKFKPKPASSPAPP
ncbi:hypothetical protein CJF32_00000651 [Rutstroemia sp. NJR-2017a WRK4]|nr:hypothetical protein CJF32_00000651 [Rutstroemia sp. NJR-2017a WRK4]